MRTPLMPHPVVRRLPAARSVPAARTVPDPAHLLPVAPLRTAGPAPGAPPDVRTAERARPRATWVLVADDDGRPRPQMRWTC